MWDFFGSFFGGDMDVGLVVTLTGVVVAGFAAILGIWMERDPSKPPRYSYALSILILLATVVSVAQSYLDAKEGEKLEEDMARMIQRMDEIASKSGDPELMALIKDELSAQARANPDVVEKLAQRVSDEGGDPAEILGKHIDASELENISRKGLMKTKEKSAKKAVADDKKEAKGKADKKAEDEKKSAADAKEAKKEARNLAKSWDELTKEEKQALRQDMTKEEKQALREARERLELKEAKANWDNLTKEQKAAWRDDKAEFMEGKEGKEGKDVKDVKDVKDGKDGKDGKGGKAGKDGKEKKGDGKAGTPSAADAKKDKDKKGKKKGKKSAGPG